MMASKGVFDLSSVGIYIGRERARKALKLRYPNSGRGPNFFTIHQLVQPVTHISDDGRVARSRLRLFQEGGPPTDPPDRGSEAPTKTGPSLKTANGSSTKRICNTLLAPRRKMAGPKLPSARPRPQARANTKAPAANTKARSQPAGVAAAFPPDLPERTEQYAFPQVAEPSYHYVNPVSGRKPPILLEAPPIP